VKKRFQNVPFKCNLRHYTSVTITPAVTVEDRLTPVLHEDTAGVVQLAVVPETSLNNDLTSIPVAYKVDAIKGGQVFYPDGVVEIFNGDFVDAENATAGLRFLPTKDYYSAGLYTLNAVGP
jgi:hypothetical protein